MRTQIKAWTADGKELFPRPGLVLKAGSIVQQGAEFRTLNQDYLWDTTSVRGDDEARFSQELYLRPMVGGRRPRLVSGEETI